MKAIEGHLGNHNSERVDEFKSKAQTYAKKIIGNFKDYEFVCIVRFFWYLELTDSRV